MNGFYFTLNQDQIYPPALSIRTVYITRYFCDICLYVTYLSLTQTGTLYKVHDKVTPSERWDWWCNFEIKRSKAKVTANENLTIVFHAYLASKPTAYSSFNFVKCGPIYVNVITSNTLHQRNICPSVCCTYFVYLEVELERRKKSICYGEV